MLFPPFFLANFDHGISLANSRVFAARLLVFFSCVGVRVRFLMGGAVKLRSLGLKVVLVDGSQ